MNRKSSRKHGRAAMSPLLRALTYSQAARDPVAQAMALQCYIALDAFRRGHGSRDSFATLGRSMLIAEELGRLGYGSERQGDIEHAHAALMSMNVLEQASGRWVLDDINCAVLSAAVALFDEQLGTASLGDIASAEARMLEHLMRAGRLAQRVEETV